MKKPPAQIATPNSAAHITGEIKKLLRATGIRDRLPTPKSEILACARLVELGEIDLEEYRASFSEKARNFFHLAISKVRGFVDRKSELYYVDPSLPEPRNLFVTYHEVSHRIFEWQRIAYTEDDDSTLSLDCSNLFESEANFGAAEILFQCERFENEARDFEPSIASGLYLAQKYGASRHASLRRFVERNHRACLLLILSPTSRENPDGGTSFYVVYSIASARFVSDFGEAIEECYINPEHEIGRILNNGGKGEIGLTDIRGFDKQCIVDCWCNSYRHFVLIYPKESLHVRRIVHIQN